MQRISWEVGAGTHEVPVAVLPLHQLFEVMATKPWQVGAFNNVFRVMYTGMQLLRYDGTPAPNL